MDKIKLYTLGNTVCDFAYNKIKVIDCMASSNSHF
jgi:hypothetical protein